MQNKTAPFLLSA